MDATRSVPGPERATRLPLVRGPGTLVLSSSRGSTAGLLLILMTLLVPLLPGAGAVSGQEALDRVDQLVEASRYGEARTILEDWWESHDGQPPRAQLARGLWYRAILTVDPSLAEMDYRRIVVEYPGGEKADEALLRLAKGAQLVGDVAAARRYLEILVQDYPGSPHRVEARALQERLAALPADDSQAPRDAPQAEEERGALRDTAVARAEEETPAQVVHGTEPEEPEPQAPRGDTAEIDPGPPEDTVVAEEVMQEPDPDPAIPDDSLPEADTLEETPEEPATAEDLPEDPPQVEEAAAPSAQPYTVQLGAFSSGEGARRMAEDVRDAGFEARIVTVEGSDFVRVRVGHFASRSEAERAAEEVQSAGLETVISSDGDRERPVD